MRPFQYLNMVNLVFPENKGQVYCGTGIIIFVEGLKFRSRLAKHVIGNTKNSYDGSNRINILVMTVLLGLPI